MHTDDALGTHVVGREDTARCIARHTARTTMQSRTAMSLPRVWKKSWTLHDWCSPKNCFKLCRAHTHAHHDHQTTHGKDSSWLWSMCAQQQRTINSSDADSNCFLSNKTRLCNATQHASIGSSVIRHGTNETDGACDTKGAGVCEVLEQ
jgi:hypothetical protein